MAEANAPDPALMVKSAEGHIVHLETLIAEHERRRDEGDGVPNAETLTKWFAAERRELAEWQGRLVTARKLLGEARNPSSLV